MSAAIVAIISPNASHSASDAPISAASGPHTASPSG